MKRYSFSTLCLFLFFIQIFSQSTSELWGEKGELWDPQGRLPDFSHAGYHSGVSPIPEIEIVVNVKDFGAVGDGKTDDYKAFKNAIAATKNGAILVPKGRYVINGLINIDKSKVVLRGEGHDADGTVLYFPRTLTDIFNSPTTSPWLYGIGGLLWVGKTSGSFTGAKVTDVSAEAKRGTKILQLNSTNGLETGQNIVLKMADQNNHSFLFHLYNNQVSGVDFPVYPGNSVAWTAKIASINGNTIELDKYLRFDVKTEWSPQIYEYAPSVQEVGVENLRIETPDQEYPGHHVDYGYNGLTFRNAYNCWARDITIKNTESPVDINGSKNCEIRNLKIMGGTIVANTTDAVGMFGHHGVSFSSNSADNLLTDFYIYDKYVHDITVAHMCNGNVIKRGIGHDMNFDHHKYSPFENLFSDINTGLGTRVYRSSGPNTGPHSAARGTFWNVKSQSWSKTPVPEWGYIQTNVIPADVANKSDDKEWYEEINDIEPKELYASQLAKRIGKESDHLNNMAPMIHPKPGIYGGEIEISIFALNTDDIVHYTTDGTEPDSSSPKYEGPFTINASAQDSFIIHAKVFTNGSGSSPLSSNKYKKDTIPPRISGMRIVENDIIKVTFNEPIDTLIAKKDINYNTGTFIEVDDVTIVDNDAIILYFSEPFEDGVTYNIEVKNITDMGGNVINSSEKIAFTYSKIMLTASSFQEGNPPEHVLDGNFDTRWSAEGYDQWLMYDLGELKIVDKVRLAFYKGNQRTTNFEILLSEDGEQWKQVFNGQSYGNTTGYESYDFEPDTVRYVKLICKGNNDWNEFSRPWNSYTEFKIDATDFEDNETTLIKSPREDKMFVFPVPAQENRIFISTPGKERKTLHLRLFDISGKPVYSKTISTDNKGIYKLDTYRLFKGMYFLVVEDDASQYKYKIVIL